jgi:glycosyltransferase involved in cell wall biosynthesis
MKTPLIVIPSYWKKGDYHSEDTIYDHPTDLLKQSETLSRILQSLKILTDTYDVLIIGIPTRSSIGEEMDQKLEKIISLSNQPARTYYFGYEGFENLKGRMSDQSLTEYSDLVSNSGYANVRNLCLLIPHILNYDIVILIDDDEIITDENFVRTATEFVGKEINEKPLGLIVGYYVNADGSILLDESDTPWWNVFWNKKKIMNRAFQIITNPDQERLVPTPFAFGGNMIIHRDCWEKVPFDPLITRGEDMDYLRNTRYFGFETRLDRKLSILHKPPKSPPSTNSKFKQDAIRFLYSKSKLESLGVDISEYEPYPGYFLRQTEGKILLTELLHYIDQNRKELMNLRKPSELVKSVQNIEFYLEEAKMYTKGTEGKYLTFQNRWNNFLKILKTDILQDTIVKVISE